MTKDISNILSNHRKLELGDLFQDYININRQPPPKNFADLKLHADSPPTAFMKPQNMINLLNAFSPYDLFLKPSDINPILDYPTSAFNIKNFPNNIGIEDAILLASQGPTNNFSPIYSIEDNLSRGEYSDIPSIFQKYIPQGIYEHEMAHFRDPRLNPSSNNYGYLKRFGLPGNIASRELPGLRAESMFFDRLLNR